MVELAVLCDRMDNDGSGALSLQEMLDGFDNDSGFQTVMQRMDIETGNFRLGWWDTHGICKYDGR